MTLIVVHLFVRRLDTFAMLLPSVKDWLLGQHAKLLRKPPRRHAKAALNEPRPEKPSGILPAGTPDNAMNPVPPAYAPKEKV